jgi:hypothetical protein
MGLRYGVHPAQNSAFTLFEDNQQLVSKWQVIGCLFLDREANEFSVVRFRGGIDVIAPDAVPEAEASMPSVPPTSYDDVRA